MKIDIFAHILPEKYLEACRKKNLLISGTHRETECRANCDIDMRLRLMDRYPDVIQVLSLSLPPVESLGSSKDAVELSQIANDEMAELVSRYPDKFISAVACLPLSDMDATLEEVDRAITQLKFKGVQIFTNIAGETLDLPKFRPLYEKMDNYDLPLWIHPYVHNKQDEPVFGWPYETADAMLRLVLSGIFQDYPDIKFITHHCGSMVSFFEQRIRWLLPLESKGRIGNPLEHFQRFYNDTAVYGSTPALKCAYDFFGAENLLFGTDMPLGPSYGLTMQTICSIEEMDVSEKDKEKIFTKNAVNLLQMAI